MCGTLVDSGAYNRVHLTNVNHVWCWGGCDRNHGQCQTRLILLFKRFVIFRLYRPLSVSVGILSTNPKHPIQNMIRHLPFWHTKVRIVLKSMEATLDGQN